jgi:tRNA-dihydrouridine synthase
MMDRTGCEGVMVGRAALGNPWLPAAMGGSPSGFPPPPAEIYRVFCIHLEKMIDWVGSERRAVLRMRKHLVWYTRGIPGAASLRRTLSQMDSAAVMKQALKDLLSIN